MNIQSFSVCVPSNASRCINNCKFCVSRMRDDDYKVSPSESAFQDMVKRLAYARDNGCNTVMLTGTCEPQQNRKFLTDFAAANKSLSQSHIGSKPFRNVEMQTTGMLLDSYYLNFLKDEVGVETISVSVSCLDNDSMNMEIIGHSNKCHYFKLEALCRMIKSAGFNLRLSLNMTSEIMQGVDFNHNNHDDIISDMFKRCNQFGADQVTFRKMYLGPEGTDQHAWLKEHSIDDSFFETLNSYIKREGRFLDTLEYGQSRYDVHGLSVVVDDDCMATDESRNAIKYLILRENGRIYSKWDSKASLIF